MAKRLWGISDAMHGVKLICDQAIAYQCNMIF